MKPTNDKILKDIIDVWNSDDTSTKILKNNLARQWYDLYNAISFASKLDKQQKDLEEKIIKDVIKLFSKIGEVIKIFYDRNNVYRNQYNFIVVTNNKVYDDNLMDKLFEIEFNLSNIYQDEYFEIHYHPNYNEFTLELIYNKE